MLCSQHRGSRTRRRNCSKRRRSPPKPLDNAYSGWGETPRRAFVRYCNVRGDARNSSDDRGIAWIVDMVGVSARLCCGNENHLISVRPVLSKQAVFAALRSLTALLASLEKSTACTGEC
jgi:hypothetical protein